ncbi:MAG: dTDP-4-amino-4,6-dideoxygalactose transaminase [Deltaproteobacteria bacterium]|nr:dTDP-4-amino-4,6-dideoxygalactose transaminase [Deltaproteobacteria bacterium]
MISFNIPLITGKEEKYVLEVLRGSKYCGDGNFNKKCSSWFIENLSCLAAYSTPSCTAALEMGLMLADIQPGDEVILPSFTFTSTATAIVLHGGIPVFIDVYPDTLHLNDNLIEAAITPRTKAIIPVHYAGVSCRMENILAIAEKYNLWVLEDAAQCVHSFDEHGNHMGAKGHMSAFSFHETKNIHCGEGGMLCVNSPKLTQRAEIIREKGTNRQQFFRGEVDKYSWQDKGSSYLMSELQAAFLLAQLEQAPEITKKRRNIWRTYHEGLAGLEKDGKLIRPSSQATGHNAHLYHILLPRADESERVQTAMRKDGVQTVFHYVPLHSSPGGKKFGRTASAMTVTDDLPYRLLRLPLHASLTNDQVDKVIETLRKHV